jgi:hypothetical protein
LEQPVTIDEVRRAMWDCNDSNALGPGGFTFSFYKTIWLLIGNKVFHMVSEFFRIRKLPKVVNISYVTLVPKNTPKKIHGVQANQFDS